MNLIKFFVPIIWIMLSIYIIECCIDMLNTPNTIAFSVGILGIFLVIYLTIKTKAGLKLITKKQKTK